MESVTAAAAAEYSATAGLDTAGINIGRRADLVEGAADGRKAAGGGNIKRIYSET